MLKQRKTLLVGALLLLALIPTNWLGGVCQEVPQQRVIHDKKPGGHIHRMYFTVEGTDCPVCLGRIEGKLAHAEGVTRAVIWKWPPYPGDVVFDANKTTWSQILESLKGETVTLRINKEEVSSEDKTKESTGASESRQSKGEKK